MPLNVISRTLSLAVAATLGLSAAQTSAPTTTAPATGKAQVTVPTGPAASAAIDIGSATGGRIVDCPGSLGLSADAVCLFATGTTEGLKPKIRTKLGTRVVENWRTPANSKNASLVFKTGAALTYVLLAQTAANDVLIIVDASDAQPTSGLPASSVFVAAADLKELVIINSFGNTTAFTIGNRTLAVTTNTKAAKVNGGNVQLPAAPYAASGQVYVPASALRSLGCTVASASKTQLNVRCGSKAATVNAVVR